MLLINIVFFFLTISTDKWNCSISIDDSVT